MDGISPSYLLAWTMGKTCNTTWENFVKLLDR